MKTLIQATPNEIVKALRKHNIIEVNGYLYSLNKSYYYMILRNLFNTLLEYKLDYTKLNLQSLLSHMFSNNSNDNNQVDNEESIQTPIIKYILSQLSKDAECRNLSYGSECSNSNNNLNNSVYTLDDKLIQQANIHLLFVDYYTEDRYRKVGKTYLLLINWLCIVCYNIYIYIAMASQGLVSDTGNENTDEQELCFPN